MIFYTTEQLLISCVLSLVFGAACGVDYPSLSLIFHWFFKIFTAELQVLKSRKLILCNSLTLSQTQHLGFVNELYDFLFFSFCGVLFCVLCYISSDGFFRVYLLALAVLTFFLSKNTLGALFKSIIYLLLNFIYRAWIILVSLLNIPIKFLAVVLLKFLSPPCKKIKHLFHLRHQRVIMSKKIKQLTYIFENNKLT